MKIAIIGSRSIKEINIEEYVKNADEIVSGGACGVDSIAAAYAKEKGIRLTVFLPEYSKYGRAAPIVRNRQIVDYSDKIIAFWDGRSKGTEYTVKYAQRVNKPCEIVEIK